MFDRTENHTNSAENRNCLTFTVYVFFYFDEHTLYSLYRITIETPRVLLRLLYTYIYLVNLCLISACYHGNLCRLI